MKDKLIVTRNFLYRLFVIGFVANIALQILILLTGGKGINEASRILELPPYFLMEMIIVAITTIRTFLFYFILCPALALHWTIARDKMFNINN